MFCSKDRKDIYVYPTVETTRSSCSSHARRHILLMWELDKLQQVSPASRIEGTALLACVYMSFCLSLVFMSASDRKTIRRTLRSP